MKKQIRGWISKAANWALGLNCSIGAELSELFWSQRFVSTIQNSKWFNGGVTPGGWAVGYPFLCILYRILDEIRPHRILELGLGQTTKLTAAYMCSDYNDGTFEHIVVEHDPEWIRFMKNSIDIRRTQIQKFNLTQRDYKGFKVTVYDGFKEDRLKGKFDLILIDAPFGSKDYSRIDILEMLPACLATDFIIMLDDYNRKGEQNMCKDLLDILNRSGIAFYTQVYSGQRDIIVVASKSRKFVCTMN